MKSKRLLLMLLLAVFVPWAANAQTPLFSEDFEGGSMPEGWTQVQITGTTNWSVATGDYSSGTGAGEGTYNAKFQANNRTSQTRLITPEIDLSGVATATLSFMHIERSWSGDIDQLRIYYRASSTDEWTLIPGQEYTSEVAAWTTEEDIPLPNISSTYQLAFDAKSNYGYGVGLDNIIIVQGASCAKPNGLAATLTPGNGSIATLNWTAGGTETNWVLEYGTASDFAGAISVNVSGTPTKDLTGLVAETTYYARVKADCGGGDESVWSATCEFKPTNALTIEILGATASTSSYLPSNTNYDYSYTQQIYTATEMGGFDCILQSIAFKGNNAAVCTLDIYLANTEKSSFSGTSDYIAISEAELVFSGEVTFTANDWTTIAFDNEFEYEGGNLAVIVDDNSGNWTYGSTTWQAFSATGQALYFYQDSNDVNPSAPSANYSSISNVKNQVMFDYALPTPYKKPKNLTVSNVTNESATVAWEAPADATPTGYKYQYMAAGGTWTDLASTTSLSANLEGLTGNTTYTFQVQAIYSDGESDFVTTTFTTECDAFAIPYEYGFEDANDMACWAIVNNDGTAGVVTNEWTETNLGYEAARSGDNVFVFLYVDYPDENPEYVTLISPELTGMVTGLHVEFYYRQDENGTESFRVGYSTTDKNLSSFTWGNAITNSTTDYKRFSANYPADVKYVAIQHTSDDQYYIFIDDLLFEEAPSCLEPTNVLASNITTTGATITWTPGADEEQWGLYVTTDITDVPDATTVPTITPVTTTTYELTTLTPATTYYVYVQADCRDASAWSSPVTFNTKCEGMDLPFSYGFEDDALSVCWGVINTNTSYNNVNISSTAPSEGSKHLDLYRGSGEGIQIIVLPEVDAAYALNEYEVTFYSKLAGSYTYGRTLAVGIMTDPEDAETFVQIGDAFTPTTTYTQYKVRFNTYTGAGQYIAIKHTSTNYGNTYVDDIEVNHLPSCLETSDPVVSNITAHTAQLDWTGYSPAYNVQYRTPAGNNGSMLNQNFDGLTTANSIPDGWDNSEGTTTSASYKWCYTTSTSGNGACNGTSHDGSKCVRFNSYMNGNGNTNFLKTPAMDFPAGKTMQLTFWWKNPTGDDFSVYISTDGGTTKTALKEGMTGQSTWKQETINLTDYMGASNVTIHFKGTSNYGSGDAYIYLDDVVIGEVVAAGAWQTASFDTNTGVISGLVAETKYEVQVQGDCGSTDGTSVWSNLVSFTTDIACPAPSALAYTNLKSSQVDLSWTNGGAENWIVAYKKTADTDFTEVDVATADVTIDGTTVTYTLNHLDAETAYTVKVRDNCEATFAGDGTSEWTSTISFTTTAACAVDNVAVSNIGHFTADVAWEGDTDSGFTVKYRTPAGIDGISEEFATTSAPTDWTRYSGALNDDGTGPTSTTTSGWSFGTNSFSSIHAYMNMYSTWKYWLVTPSITVGSGYSFSFDVAYTAYNSTSAAGTTGTDDRFCVLISTDEKAHWTILREWNNDGTGDAVLNDIPTTFQTIDDIDIRAYEGQTVYIAFYGGSTESNTDNTLRIDNVTCGTPVAAGAWQTVSATESPATIDGLEAGTKYELTVYPNCDETLASDPVEFTTVSPNTKYFLTEGNWDVAANWEPEGAPTLTQTVELRANATIPNGCVAEANSISGTGTGDDAKTLTIEDGGQLKHNNANVRATVKKSINAFPDVNVKSGYYLISNPLYTNLSTTSTPTLAATGILTGDYDFFNWNNTASDGLEWRAYDKAAFSMSYGLYGYLYANAVDTELSFTGTIQKSDSYSSRYLSTYEATAALEFKSWYLLGNPYVCDAYLVNASTNGTALPYYRMNANGDGFEAVANGAPVHPMEGIFYEATSTASVYMVRTAPNVTSNGNGNLNIVLAQNVTARGAKGSTDNAIIRFGEGNTLSKFSFNENNAKVYIPQDGKDYAVVNAGNVGEMPVNFKTSENGTYTLSFNSENVTFSYLHLIDNMTGADVDLLETPSYSFDARYTDYASRFRLVFATGSSIDGDSFGYVNGNGNLSIFGIEGEATVQVIDMLGHILSSETFSGSYEKQLNAAPGVYMIRLINGNDVKVQKIVIK